MTMTILRMGGWQVVVRIACAVPARLATLGLFRVRVEAGPFEVRRWA